VKPKKSNRTTPPNPEMRRALRKSEVARSQEKDSQETPRRSLKSTVREAVMRPAPWSHLS